MYYKFISLQYSVNVIILEFNLEHIYIYIYNIHFEHNIIFNVS